MGIYWSDFVINLDSRSLLGLFLQLRITAIDHLFVLPFLAGTGLDKLDALVFDDLLVFLNTVATISTTAVVFVENFVKGLQKGLQAQNEGEIFIPSPCSSSLVDVGLNQSLQASLDELLGPEREVVLVVPQVGIEPKKQESVNSQ